MNILVWRMFLISNRHIFTVPETVAKTEVWIEEGKLLQVPLVTTRETVSDKFNPSHVSGTSKSC